jgi:hypothetical protein
MDSGVPAPVSLYLRKTGFRGASCYLATTTRSTVRGPIWANPFDLELCKAGFRGTPRSRNPTIHSTVRTPVWANSLRTNRQRYRERIAVRYAAPCGIFGVSAGSGARHRADPCKTGLAALPESNNTLNVSRAGSGEFLAYEPGTAFAERIAVRFAPPLNWNLVSAGSGAHHRADPCKTGLIVATRRAPGTQQHAQRFARRFGRIPCAQTGNAIAKGSPCAMRPR